MHNMRDIGTALMLFAAVPLIVFPFFYHFTSHGMWRRTQMGIHLMSFMGVLSAVMTLAVANFLAGGSPTTHSTLPEWVRPVCWLAIGIVSWWRLGILLKVQREVRSDNLSHLHREGAGK